MTTLARENPFASDRLEALRYVPLHWSWEEMMFRIDEMGYRGAIVGPEGCGKTTLLLDLGARLRTMGFEIAHLRLTADERRFVPGQLRKFFSQITDKHIILFD